MPSFGPPAVPFLTKQSLRRQTPDRDQSAMRPPFWQRLDPSWSLVVALLFALCGIAFPILAETRRRVASPFPCWAAMMSTAPRALPLVLGGLAGWPCPFPRHGLAVQAEAPRESTYPDPDLQDMLESLRALIRRVRPERLLCGEGMMGNCWTDDEIRLSRKLDIWMPDVLSFFSSPLFVLRQTIFTTTPFPYPHPSSSERASSSYNSVIYITDPTI